jgi:DNA-binding CsgD family transcriptional regulator
MQHRSPSIFAEMSPAAFVPFDGIPGVCAVARDSEFRQVWCNEEYARLHGTSPALMRGQSLWDVLPTQLADERAALMRPALEQGQLVAYYQLWRGALWLTRCWPLGQPEAFGLDGGYFVVLSRLGEPPEERREGDGRAVRFLKTADMGDLAVLSEREREVFYYLALGLTMQELAKLLFRSPKTIERHAESIHRKLGLSSRAELVRLAVERGVVAFTPVEWRALEEGRPRRGDS